MLFIVCIKQVPDVHQIGDDAFNPETGQLMRGRLPVVVNELDLQALALAVDMKKMCSDRESRIVAVTMGPPSAEVALREVLSCGADEAVLLSDPAFGGADTYATASVLAAGIANIMAREPQVRGHEQQVCVMCGMQSVDGDTAQVPAQIARELGLPVAGYVTGATWNDARSRFEFERVIIGGREKVTPVGLSYVLTVARHEYPVFATLESTRRAAGATIRKLTSADIKPREAGAHGSKTAVIRIFPPAIGGRPSRRLDTVEQLYEKMLKAASGEVLAPACTPVSKTRDLQKLPAKLYDFRHSPQGEVWVVAEVHQGRLHPATIELIGAARQLAADLDVRVGVLCADSAGRALADECAAWGADSVYVPQTAPQEFDPVQFADICGAAIDRFRPQIALYAATPRGRLVAPMIAYSLYCGLTADCTELDIRIDAENGLRVLAQTRPALGGNIMATIISRHSFCQMATARPGVFARPSRRENARADIIEFDSGAQTPPSLLTVAREQASAAPVLDHARIIVAGGRGLRTYEQYQQLMPALRDSLGRATGLRTELGASRAAVEQGFISREYQVGQTGISVRPDLYLAIGISGAIQHTVGISGSRCIMAVNPDPEAPIFRHADYYLVARAEDVVPRLTEMCEANNKRAEVGA